MKRQMLIAAMMAPLGAPCLAQTDFYEGIARSLTVQCSYSDYKSFQFENVSIERTTKYVGEAASAKTFERGKNSEDVTYIVKPGEAAECVFPSGNRIRVKVGEGEARPYGMCGGDPQVFASIWVNKRKIASRIWFAGHCREEQGNPDVSFKISGGPRVLVQKCHSDRLGEDETGNGDSTSTMMQPMSVCVDFPEVSRFPRDEIEYPPPGRKVSAAGEIELLSGEHEVCKAVHEELKADFYTFGHYSNQEAIKLSRPTWSTPSVELPEELAGSRESVFDFDNDGTLDRVISRHFESTYLDGSVLLVQPGSSSSKLNVPASPMDKSSSFVPCQMSSTQYEIRDCPTFSQKADEAGFSFKGRANKESIYFRARYSSVSPFTFEGDNFVGVNSKSEDSKNFVAVLKPVPQKVFQPMCLFRKVTENF